MVIKNELEYKTLSKGLKFLTHERLRYHLLELSADRCLQFLPWDFLTLGLKVPVFLSVIQWGILSEFLRILVQQLIRQNPR